MTLGEELVADLQRRAQTASQSWRPGCRVVSVEPLTGGTSSLTFPTRLEGVPESEAVVVLKVAPPGLPPLRNQDVLRQGTLMRALSGRQGVVVPEVLFEDAGEPPDVPPFLAMNLVPGECLEPILRDEPEPSRSAQFHDRAFDAARVLAAIHRLEPEVIGLGAEPVVSIKDEIDRWTRAMRRCPLTSSSTIPRWPRRSTPRSRPPSGPPSTTATIASATPCVSTAM